jgi:Ca-activated chloride channel homolog
MSNDTSHGFTFGAEWERPLASPGGSSAFRIRVEAPAQQDGQRRTPTDVAFILDRSGSMGGSKIELVKNAVDEACRHLSDADRASLVVFDNEIDLLQALEPATGRVKTSIRMALLGVDARGGTNLSGGWLTGCQELDTPPALPGARTRRAVLLTDGQANDGICDPRELGRHANRIRQLGVSTTTIGVGYDFDEFLLSAMAEAGGGNFQFIEDPAECRAFFEKELQELFSAVALGMTLTITCPDGVHARPVSVFPAERTGRTWTLAIGEVPAGEVLDIIFDVTVKDGFGGSELALGVEVAWSDPATDRRRNETVRLAPLGIASADEVAAAPVVPEIASIVALQRAAHSKRQALEAERRGDRVIARARMDEGWDLLSAAPEDPDVEEERHDYRFMLASLDTFGQLSEEVRKSQVWKENQRRRNRTDFRERRARQQGTPGDSQPTEPSGQS